MQSAANRFASLFGRRSDKAAAAAKSRRRAAKNRVATPFESLESRAMLAVSAIFANDLLPGTAPAPRGTGGSWNALTSSNGSLTITLNASNDQVFMRVVNQGTQQFYEIASDSQFTSPVTIDFREVDATHISTNDMGITKAPGPVPAAGTYLGTTAGVFNTATTIAAGVSARGLISIDDPWLPFNSLRTTSTFVTADPNIGPTNLVVSAGTRGSIASNLTFIRVRADNTNLTGLGFTMVGGTLDANDMLTVDFEQNEDSFINLGGSLSVKVGGNFANGGAVGGLYLAAQRVEINSPVVTKGDVTLISADDVPNSNSWTNNLDTNAGIFVNAPITVPGGNAVTIRANRSTFQLADSQSIAAAGGNFSNFSLSLTDSSAIIGGTINAATQVFKLQATERVGDGRAQSITTYSPATGKQQGAINGDLVVMNLYNDAAAAGTDSTVDIQGAVNKMRFDTLDPQLVPLDVNFKLVDTAPTLTMDTVFSSQGRVEIQANNTFQLKAAIQTIGDLVLTSGTDLTLATPVSSTGGNVSVTSSTGKVSLSSDLNAPLGTVSVSSNKDVTIASRVSGQSVSVTSTTGKILLPAGTGTAADSRVSGNVVSLQASTGIDAGVDTGFLTVAPSQGVGSSGKTGLVKIRDLGTSGSVTLSSVRTGGSDFSLTSGQDIEAQLVNADVGSITLKTTGTLISDDPTDPGATTHAAFINLGTVIGTAVTLEAVKYDLDDVTAINGGVITGNAPNANEISWTTYNSVPAAELYNSIGIVTAKVLSATDEVDIAFDATGAVLLKDVQAPLGAITVTANGQITATNLVATGDVSLRSNQGTVTVNKVTTDGSVTIIGAEGIASAGIGAGIVATDVRLSVGSTGVASSIGASGNSIVVNSPNAEVALRLTVTNASDLDATVVAANTVDPSDVFISSSSAIDIDNISVSGDVTVKTVGAASHVAATRVVSSKESAKISLQSGGNVTLGAVQVAADSVASGVSLGIANSGITLGKTVSNVTASTAALATFGTKEYTDVSVVASLAGVTATASMTNVSATATVAGISGTGSLSGVTATPSLSGISAAQTQTGVTAAQNAANLTSVATLSATASKTTGLFTTTSPHRLGDGAAVTFSAAVAGFSANTPYYVVSSSPTTFSLAATPDGVKLAVSADVTVTLNTNVIQSYGVTQVAATATLSGSAVAALANVTGVATLAVDYSNATNLLTRNGHVLENGTRVFFAAVQGPFAANTPYFVINKTTNTFQLSATPGGQAVTGGTSFNAQTLTVNVFTNTANHGLINGSLVTVTAGGAITNGDYYVVNATSKTFQLASTVSGVPSAVTAANAVQLNGVFAASGHPLGNGNVIQFRNSAPTGFATGVDYIVLKSGPSSFQLAATGTPTTPVAITTSGSVSFNANVFKKTAHGFSTGDMVAFTANTGTTAVKAGTKYFVVNASTDSFQLSATLGGAVISGAISTVTQGNPSSGLQLAKVHGLANGAIVNALSGFGGLQGGSKSFVVGSGLTSFQVASAVSGSPRVLTSATNTSLSDVLSTVTVAVSYSGNNAVPAANKLDANNHGLQDGTRVSFAASYGPFVAGDYYVINATTNDFQLSVAQGGAVVTPSVASIAIPASLTVNVFTKVNHALQNGAPVALAAGNAAGVAAGNYFVINSTTDTFQLSATQGGVTPVAVVTLVAAVPGTTVTADAALRTNLITAVGHGLANGASIAFNSTLLGKGANNYVVTNAGTDTFQLELVAGTSVQALVDDSTVTATKRLFTSNNHGLADGAKVQLTAAGTSGLAANTVYTVRNVTANTFQLYDAAGNAVQSPSLSTADMTLQVDLFRSAAHGMGDGTVVQFSVDAPAGFAINTPYYVINSTVNTFRLATAAVAVPSAATAITLGSNVFKKTAHGLANGTAVQLSAAITGFTTAATYYVTNATADSFQLSASKGGSPQAVSGRPTGITLKANVLNKSAHDLADGMRVVLAAATGGYAAGHYYVVNSSTNAFQLATAVGGAVVRPTNATNVTGFSLGTNLFTKLAHSLPAGATVTVTNADGSGVATATAYIVTAVGANTFQLATTANPAVPVAVGSDNTGGGLSITTNLFKKAGHGLAINARARLAVILGLAGGNYIVSAAGADSFQLSQAGAVAAPNADAVNQTVGVDLLTRANHGLSNGTVLKYTAATASGFIQNSLYKVAAATVDTFQLLDVANANAVTEVTVAAAISFSTGLFTKVGHGLANGDTLQFVDPDAAGLPTGAGFALGTNYKVLNVTADTFQLETAGAPTIPLYSTGGTNTGLSLSENSSTFTLQRKSVTALTAASDKLTSNGHGLVDGTRVAFIALAGPFAQGTVYYVVSAATNDFKLSLSRGGAAVDITVNSGAATLVVNPFTNGDSVQFTSGTPDGGNFPPTGTYVVLNTSDANGTFQLATTATPAVAVSGLPTSTGIALGTLSDTFTKSAHGLRDGQWVRFVGTAPANFDLDEIYYVTGSDTNTFKLSLTPAGAAITGTGLQGLELESASFTADSQIQVLASRDIISLTDGGNRIISLVDSGVVDISASSVVLDLSGADSVKTLKAKATGSSGLMSIKLDRADDIGLNGISAANGNVTITQAGIGDLVIGAGGILAGSATSTNSVFITSAGDIRLPDVASTGGTITANSTVSLITTGDLIDVKTSAVQLEASAASTIKIAETDDARIGSGNVTTTVDGGTVTLAFGGALQSGMGSIVTANAAVTARSIDVRTSVDSLSATATTGSLAVLESSNLGVGANGISATNGAVSIRVTKGNIVGAGSTVTGTSVGIVLDEGGNSIDVDTNAASIAASTAGGELNYGSVAFAKTTGLFTLAGTVAMPTNGTILKVAGLNGDTSLFDAANDYYVVNVNLIARQFQLATSRGGDPLMKAGYTGPAIPTLISARNDITIRNSRGFTVDTSGISAGTGGVRGTGYVSLTTAAGAIGDGNGGTIFASDLFLDAAAGINVDTQITGNVTASAVTGNIVVDQTNNSMILKSVIAGAGSASVSNNSDVTVEYIGSQAATVTVTGSTGGEGNKITLAGVAGTEAIRSEFGTVTLTAAGGIAGVSRGTESNGLQSQFVPDVIANTVSLTSTSGGSIMATVDTDSLIAQANGSANADIDITQLASRTVFIDSITASGANKTRLSAAGSVKLWVADANDSQNGTDVVIIAAPAAGGSSEVNTDQTTYFVVSTANATGTGSLGSTLGSFSQLANALGGSRGVVFSTAVTTPIQLRDQVALSSTIAFDGSRRINTATGAFTSGALVYVDGSRVAGDGFVLSAGADNSLFSNIGFYGFSGGAALKVDGANDVTIRNSVFGLTSAQRTAANFVGIEVAGSASGTIISGNTVSANTTGILLTDGATNTVISRGTFGTNAARSSLPNVTAVRLDSAGSGNQITSSFFGFNTTGVAVADTSVDPTAPTVISANEMLNNTSAIVVSGGSDQVTIAGNTITRSKNSGIVVQDSAGHVVIGGTRAGRNFIGTTSRGSLGLGNFRSGVVLSATGVGNDVSFNEISGNGVGRSSTNGSGIVLDGTAAGTTVNANTLASNRFYGVHARNGAAATITGNTFNKNSQDGVRVESGANVAVGGDANDMSASAPAGVGNTFTNNSGFGVNVRAGAFAQIRFNSMTGNRLGGISNATATSHAIRSITMDSSRRLVITFTTTPPADAVIDIYVAATGNPQGRTWVARATGADVGTGNRLVITAPSGVNVGTQLSAAFSKLTASGVSTSSFARALGVTRSR